MLIPHPTLGLRDSREFICLGDARLLGRPCWKAPDALDAFHDYVHLRDNPAGLHRELWFHAMGDQSWLVVTRDTVTHEIFEAVFASDLVRGSR